MNIDTPKHDTLYRRAFARIIDFIIFAILNFIISLILSLFRKPRTMGLVIGEDNNPRIEMSNLNNTHFSLIEDWFTHNNFYTNLLFIVYMIFMNYYFGKSLGKMCTNLKVMNINEVDKISFLSAIKRSLFGLLYLPILYFFEDNLFVTIGIFIYFILNTFQVLSNNKKLTFEDLFAKTVVIKS